MLVVSYLQLLAVLVIASLYALMFRQLFRFPSLPEVEQFKRDSVVDERKFVFAVRSSITTPVPKAPLKEKRA